MTVFGIQRDERYSPNSVEKDLAILRAVVEPLKGQIVPESQFTAALVADPSRTVVFSMARSQKTLGVLYALSILGAWVVNSPGAIAMCQRSWLAGCMSALNIPQPPAKGDNGCWLKRGDGSAQSKDDVVFCADGVALNEAVKSFRNRGITDYVAQTHVEGDLIKFYGVLGTGFFRTFYPGDDGQSKFGDEEHNGLPHHYVYATEKLQTTAELLAEAIDLPIYGGDAIIRPDGSFVVIDFNDWPSFSRCREEAAVAIIKLTNNENRYRKQIIQRTTTGIVQE